MKAKDRSPVIPGDVLRLLAERTVEKCGWALNDWCRSVGVSRAKTYQLLGAGVIVGRKDGRATIIVTAPADYLKSLPRWLPGKEPSQLELSNRGSRS